ncbi:hypothetical protein CDL15_Pgr018500 [Punica granatum]|uniref:Uncharacterized protein n=1 Tax=Punica granatum TaxID=22663 RepID=A0A218X0E4_PUNGR|nr:hypothetical protein CDL15_Pgr018500 [Punica granatum]
MFIKVHDVSLSVRLLLLFSAYVTDLLRSCRCSWYRRIGRTRLSSSVAISALRISSTDPPPTLEEERRLNAKFLSRGKGKQKHHVDLEEGFDESDDPVHAAEPILTESRRPTDPPPTLEEERRLNAKFLSRGKGKQKHHVDLEKGSDESNDPVHVAEPILTESRRQVPKRSQSKSSQMQECMDIFRESFTKNQQDTPPSAKKSKSVSSPEKPEKNSIEEALNELAKLESRILQSLFVKAS